MYDDGLVTKCNSESSGRLVKETMTERLARERNQVQQRLDDLNKAIALLEKNPTVQEVIDVLSSITHF